MHADAGPAGTAELPARRVELGHAGEVGGLGDLDAVRKRQALRAGTGKAEADLAAGLEVVDVVVERAGVTCRHELGDRGEVALAHCRLEVGARGAFGEPPPAPDLGQQDVALAAELPQVLFKRSHTLSEGGEASLEVRGVGGGEVITHDAEVSGSLTHLSRLVPSAPVAKPGEQSDVVDDLQPAAGKERKPKRGGADRDAGERRADR